MTAVIELKVIIYHEINHIPYFTEQFDPIAVPLTVMMQFPTVLLSSHIRGYSINHKYLI